MFLRNVGIDLQGHTALQLRRLRQYVVHTTLQRRGMRQYVPPRRWYLPTCPHGVTTQKTNFDNHGLTGLGRIHDSSGTGAKDHAIPRQHGNRDRITFLS
jgi:hypothetical protein